MTDIRLALWPVDFSYPVSSIEAWLELVANKAQEAKDAGAKMLVLPEYVCVHWLSFAKDLPSGESFAWMDALRPQAIAGIQNIAKEKNIAIVAGTYPVLVSAPFPPVMYPQPNDKRQRLDAPRYYNRAYVIGDDGEILHEQDKMVITPWEMDEDNDNIHSGGKLGVFDYAGICFGLLICLDVQQPVLNRQLLKRGIDVLLVPSMTLHPSGYNRVFTCAKARAIEGLIGVAVVGARGVPPYLEGKETNYAGAAIYGPCEMDMQADGVIASSVPDYGMTQDAGALCVGDIPVSRIRDKRVLGAEAWPGLIEGE